VYHSTQGLGAYLGPVSRVRKKKDLDGVEVFKDLLEEILDRFPFKLATRQLQTRGRGTHFEKVVKTKLSKL
jgi:hypothetical protein